MEIWAHAMIKNEARWLWFSVTSIIEYVDKVLLWDTGSTDGSLEIERDLKQKYSDKIILNRVDQESIEDFTNVRQKMLDSTKSDWFLMLDGDEIWWQDSIRSLLSAINKNQNSVESIVVPTVNVVGDIFHFQENSSGRYKFGNYEGHYNLRAINRNIPGLHSQGVHGVWGWADGENKMIQNRDSNKIKFIDAPYLHATFLKRSGTIDGDLQVVKRSKKLKHEIGRNFPLDYFYPESFFKNKPENIPSPWKTMSDDFKLRSIIETPLRKIKRKFWQGGIGY